MGRNKSPAEHSHTIRFDYGRTGLEVRPPRGPVQEIVAGEAPSHSATPPRQVHTMERSQLPRSRTTLIPNFATNPGGDLSVTSPVDLQDEMWRCSRFDLWTISVGGRQIIGG